MVAIALAVVIASMSFACRSPLDRIPYRGLAVPADSSGIPEGAAEAISFAVRNVTITLERGAFNLLTDVIAVEVNGSDLPSLGLPLSLAGGSYQKAINEVVLGSSAARIFAVSPGNGIHIGGHDYRVCGILAETGTHLDRSMIMENFPSAWQSGVRRFHHLQALPANEGLPAQQFAGQVDDSPFQEAQLDKNTPWVRGIGGLLAAGLIMLAVVLIKVPGGQYPFLLSWGAGGIAGGTALSLVLVRLVNQVFYQVSGFSRPLFEMTAAGGAVVLAVAVGGALAGQFIIGFKHRRSVSSLPSAAEGG